MAKVQYYYNGKLIRTSDHTYTHAVIDTKTGKAVACRNGLDKAESARNAEVSLERGNIKYYEDMIKALKAGRNYFFYKIGRCTEKARIDDGMTIEKAETRIDEINAWIEKRMNELVIVPIDAK